MNTKTHTNQVGRWPRKGKMKESDKLSDKINEIKRITKIYEALGPNEKVVLLNPTGVFRYSDWSAQAREAAEKIGKKYFQMVDMQGQRNWRRPSLGCPFRDDIWYRINRKFIDV